MKKNVVLWVVGLLVFADMPARAQDRGLRQEEREAARRGWLSSLAEGKAEARRTGKPLMVVLRCEP